MNEHDNRLPAAALLGLAGGIRTTAPLAALTAHGRLVDGPARWAVFGATAAELAADKLPMIPPRTAPLPLLGRVAAAAAAGATVGGTRGAVAAAVVGGAATYGAKAARVAIVRRSGVPDPVVAVAEDAIALGIGVLGARMVR